MSIRTGKDLIKAAAVIIAVSAAVICIISAFATGDNLPNINEVLLQLGISEKTGGSFVRFMDVGQGDCILISSKGRNLLIDSGPPASSDELVLGLKSLASDNIDVMLLSHFHDDHYGGLDMIAENFSVAYIIMPDIIKTNEKMPNMRAALMHMEKSGAKLFTASPGLNFKLGDFEITVLAYSGDNNEENNRSVIALAEIDGFRFLFTGDVEEELERKLVDNGINLKCDVLKVAHHGSKSSSSAAFLNASRPEYAVISCGVDNNEGHPDDKTLRRLKKVDSKIFRTDISGDITFCIEDKSLRVETEK